MKVLIIGAGQMGNGIAQVCAQAGYETYLNDLTLELAEKGLLNIEKNLIKMTAKGKLDEAEKNRIMSRITLTDNYDAGADCDIVIEAATENLGIKQKIFASLDSVCDERTILATNTSSLPITEIAAATKRAEKVIGMHFMQPVPVMSLVEIIRGIATSDETYKAIEKATIEIGKFPVEVKDVPGFVSNRVLQMMINEAIYCVYEGVATPAGIDEVMKRGMNHPMGPLALADFIGLDTVYSIMQVMHEGYGDSKYRPCPLLRQYVKAGWLGKKTGKGFYEYK